MMLVIDASALVAILGERDQDGRWATAAVAGERLAAPHIVLAETSNSLRRLERRGYLSGGEANRAHRELAESSVSLFEFGPFAERIWELRNNLSSYDAWYVAIAEALDCPLVTLDLRMSRSPGPTCTFLTPPDEDV